MLVMFVGMIIQAAIGVVSATELQPEDTVESMGVFMIAAFVIQAIISFVLGNLLVVNQGIIYYSCKEDDENHSLNNEIDLIGSDVE
jgi:sorbitol-specific phosphotransferase system component IIBC